MSVEDMGLSIMGEGHVHGPRECREQKLSVKVKY